MGDTQRSSSYLNLDPQSSLEELLAGEETTVLNTLGRQRVDRINNQIEGLRPRAAAGDKGAQRSIENLQRKIERTESANKYTQVERGPGYLQDSFLNLVELAESPENLGDITRGRQAQLDLANYLSSLSAPEAPELMGPMPGQREIGYAQQFSQDIFAPQQNQLNQLFDDQRMQANRAAAIQGRAGNDPVTLARMAQAQAREQSMLGSQQTALAAQTARELPFQFNQISQQRYQNQLGNLLQNVQFRAQGAQAMQDLGQQALRNRLSVLGVGSGLLGAEQQFRLATATQNQQTSSSPGALSIAGGLLGAAGTIGSIAAGFQGSSALGQIANYFKERQH